MILQLLLIFSIFHKRIKPFLDIFVETASILHTFGCYVCIPLWKWKLVKISKQIPTRHYFFCSWCFNTTGSSYTRCHVRPTLKQGGIVSVSRLFVKRSSCGDGKLPHFQNSQTQIILYPQHSAHGPVIWILTRSNVQSNVGSAKIIDGIKQQLTTLAPQLVNCLVGWCKTFLNFRPHRYCNNQKSKSSVHKHHSQTLEKKKDK